MKLFEKLKKGVQKPLENQMAFEEMSGMMDIFNQITAETDNRMNAYKVKEQQAQNEVNQWNKKWSTI